LVGRHPALISVSSSVLLADHCVNPPRTTRLEGRETTKQCDGQGAADSETATTTDSGASSSEGSSDDGDSPGE
jgi:hypothetical protein